MTYRVALFSMDGGEYQRLLRDDCVHAARRLGFPVQLFDAGNEAPVQARQIEGCLNGAPEHRPNLVIVSPVNEASLYATALTAARLGIGWMMLLRWADYIRDLRQQFPDLPIFAVMADQNEVGRIQGRQLLSLLPDGGDVVYIRGPLATSSARRRFAGLQDALRGSSIQLSLLDSDFTVAGGKRVIEGQSQIFQCRGRHAVVVAAQNDSMAMGARDALEEAARTDLLIAMDRIAFCGIDGTPSYGQRLVREGKLTATVIMPSGAGRALEAAAAHRLGGHRPIELVSLQPLGYPEPHDLRVLSSSQATAATGGAGKRPVPASSRTPTVSGKGPARSGSSRNG